MYKILYSSVIIVMYYTTSTAPQSTEGATEQLEITDPVTAAPFIQNETEKNISENVVITPVKTEISKINTAVKDESFYVILLKLISNPVFKFIRKPKVNQVLRNIGTCLVNGAMEIFSYFLPPPFMPIIAALAGLAIPFEPVVMLKQKMPVTSYRRAFKTAMNTFLSTFDQYKVDEDDFDPYMTRRFNRRFMDDKGKNKEVD